MAENLQYLYNVEWQCIRVSMLGTWNSFYKASDNYTRLREYTNNATTVQERKRRLWRVINYLNAVRMGYSGQGLYGFEIDILLVLQRNYFQEMYKDHGNISLGEWDWDIVGDDLRKLHSEDRKMFLAILANLEKRKEFAKKKVGTLKYRNELQIFVDMMREVDNNE